MSKRHLTAPYFLDDTTETPTVFYVSPLLSLLWLLLLSFSLTLNPCTQSHTLTQTHCSSQATRTQHQPGIIPENYSNGKSFSFFLLNLVSSPSLFFSPLSRSLLVAISKFISSLKFNAILLIAATIMHEEHPLVLLLCCAPVKITPLLFCRPSLDCIFKRQQHSRFSLTQCWNCYWNYFSWSYISYFLKYIKFCGIFKGFDRMFKMISSHTEQAVLFCSQV